MTKWATDWVAAGKPKTKTWTTKGYVYRIPPIDGQTVGCSSLRERQLTAADREEFYSLKPGCRAGFEASQGLDYNATLGGYAGAGVEATHRVLTPTTPAASNVQSFAPTASHPFAPYTPPATRSTILPDALRTATLPSGGSDMRRASPLGATGPKPRIIDGPTLPPPQGDQMSFRPASGLAPIGPSNDWMGALTGAVGGFLTGGPAGAVVGGLAGYAGTGGGESPSSPGTQYPGYGGAQSFGSGCPTGYHWENGQCVKSGVGGWLQQTIPGGQTGTGVDVYGQATVGAFGKAALVPFTGQQIVNRCPPGAVLGKDNLCYDRRSIRNSDRKWPKPPRPFISAAEKRLLGKIKSVQNKAKGYAQDAGFTCRKK